MTWPNRELCSIEKRQKILCESQFSCQTVRIVMQIEFAWIYLQVHVIQASNVFKQIRLIEIVVRRTIHGMPIKSLCRSKRIVILHLTKSAIQSSFSLLSPLSKTCNSSSSDALYVMKSSSNSYRVIVFDDALAEQRWTLHSPQRKPKTRLRSESKRRRMECR